MSVVPSPTRSPPLAVTPGVTPGVTLALILAGLVTGACRDPIQDDAEAYVAAMSPVLVDNMGLTRQFVEVATQVKKGSADPKDVARRFQDHLVPDAVRLRDAVVAIQATTPQLEESHRGLAEAWTARVEVYAELHRSWDAADQPAFDAAVYRNLLVKAAEEQYFTDVNLWLGARGLSLDQYP